MVQTPEAASSAAIYRSMTNSSGKARFTCRCDARVRSAARRRSRLIMDGNKQRQSSQKVQIDSRNKTAGCLDRVAATPRMLRLVETPGVVHVLLWRSPVLVAGDGHCHGPGKDGARTETRRDNHYGLSTIALESNFTPWPSSQSRRCTMMTAAVIDPFDLSCPPR